jgi:hypothetical protein
MAVDRRFANRNAIRRSIADGAILEKHAGEFWQFPSGGGVNRLQEWVTWSSKSRWMIRMLDERWDTSMVNVFAFDADDNLTGPFDLLNVTKPALRARAWLQMRH